MQTQTPPPWLTETCPPWCVVLHEVADHERDRRHVSASLSVPVLALRGVGEPLPPEEDEVTGEDLALVLHRRVGDDETWLYVGDGRNQGLELSVASWSRVVPGLDRLIAVGRT
ncbi:DUF6907 domain-containing protein [Cellulomonas denverensis]|uniref:Uncharacterized protein n=1 Tax=Cellulomonas denverensis TaxID=264297 RepID=A0A7X6KY18_9CELL|nr:hypothetical protein [Cellulomonas denverensis]NKY24109.1 hypothetical protein [Cellulomonas denverensis]GIG25284.1 hypothetical protein Cde04nite_15280 [Cellulomonas denverensis]